MDSKERGTMIKVGYYRHIKDGGLIYCFGPSQNNQFKSDYYLINDLGYIDKNLQGDYTDGYLKKYYRLLSKEQFKQAMIKKTLKGKVSLSKETI